MPVSLRALVIIIAAIICAIFVAVNFAATPFEKLITLAQQHEIKKTSLELQQRINDLDDGYYYYSFTFKIPLEDIASEDTLWKILKIKSKRANLFAPNILECNVIETMPQGFIREITMTGPNGFEHARERVVIDELTKTIFFFMLETDGKNKLIAFNSIKREDKQLFFVGTYVLDIRRPTEIPAQRTSSYHYWQSNQITDQIDSIFSNNIELMIQNIKNFINKDLVDSTYNQLFAY